MTDIILHHYPQSPVAEKVRVGLGIKRASWRSVEVERLPPRRELAPMIGDYRRVPVMQIGADLYCDSQCILRELQNRLPEPTFYPGGAAGLPWAVGRWMETSVFDAGVAVVLGGSADDMPENFARDRARLYFGPDGNVQDLKADIAHNIAQVRGQLGWIDERMASGRAFILGDDPGLPDAMAYYLIWFLRGRWSGGADLLSEFPALEAWEARVREIGYGTSTLMSPEDALAVGANAEPQTAEEGDARDPQGLAPGMAVTVVPMGDGGDPAIAGTIRLVNKNTIAILREDDAAGWFCVHFPRIGYRVSRV